MSPTVFPTLATVYRMDYQRLESLVHEHIHLPGFDTWSFLAEMETQNDCYHLFTDTGRTYPEGWTESPEVLAGELPVYEVIPYLIHQGVLAGDHPYLIKVCW